MKYKVVQSKRKNSDLKVVIKAKPKAKSPKGKKQISNDDKNTVKKRGRKSLNDQSPNKLSTLDNWLRTLYKSPSQVNQNSPSTSPSAKEAAKENEDHTNTCTEDQNINKANEKKPPVKPNTKTKNVVPKESPTKPVTKLFLYIKLDKVNLEQMQNEAAKLSDHQESPKESLKENKGDKKIQPKKRHKIEGLNHKNRSSEYTRLENKEYKCAKCDFTSPHIITMRGHFDKEHSSKILECNLCPFQTTQEYYFNSHVRSHGKPDQECPHCNKMIKWFSYKMHIKTHERNDQSEYKCEFCDYKSYNHANVKRHVLALHKDPHQVKPYSCDSCSYVTVLEERLKVHKRVVHSSEGVWLQCPQCEYTTRIKAHMKRHVNDLHGDKNVQCTLCPKYFSSKANLKCHMKRKHDDQSTRKFYYCEMCPKEQQYKTTEKGNLARHILAHRTLDEIEVFACHKCPYMGKTTNCLKTHLINAHLPEMHKFRCSLCGYSTSTKSRYNAHINQVHGRPRADKFKRKKAVSNNRNDVNDEIQTAIEDVVIKEESGDYDSMEDEGIEGELNKSGPVKQFKLTDFWATKHALKG